MKSSVLILAGILYWMSIGAVAQTYTRTEQITYYDNTTKWVLGQVAKVTCVAPTTALPTGCGAAGTVISETTFDPTYALPLTSKSFGKLQQTLTYDTTSTVVSGQLGTVKTIKDGNNNITTLSSWKRGIPQSIKYPITTESPTGAVQSAVVNNNGEIDSVTDETGAKTCYTYDPMGRLASITYPSEATLGACDTAQAFWKKTNITFQPIAVAEYGIPAGHWRQVITTGNANKSTYFDALWRPLVTKELDATSTTTETLTKRFQRMAYDENGRIAFASYPGTTDALTTGTWTEYDALGRTTSVTQDSELGLLTTLTAYSSDATGPYTRTTNPRGVRTVTRYQMFDQPNYDFPVLIDQAQNLPERVGIDIARDMFGKPLSIRKRNSASTISLTRSYTYNANQELCRISEPETGATLMGYDGAGNLAWSAAGLPAATACDPTGTTAAVVARKASRTYDARNRVKTLSFVGGLGNTSSTYTPDGLLASIVAQNGGTNVVTTSYNYNKRRLAVSERMQWGDIDWPIYYGYNANGHLSLQSWHGLAIDYVPNALGQPTQAGSYASGVSYYPNGAIKGFTYGNGIAYSMLQNSRQLPERGINCTVAGVGCASVNKRLDLSYSFDETGNVSGITDNMGGPQTRAMTYDGLDRLTQTTSVPFGTASYTYDVLDNLTRMTVGASNQVAARDQFYCYNATTRRLDFVRNTSCSGGAVIALDYDVQGNLKNKNNHLHTFDFGNRLRSISIAGIPTASYVYDGHGRRVRDYTTASKYSQYTQNGQLSMTSDGRANKVTEYVYLGGSLVATRERDAANVYTVKYQHTDALGSPIAVTNASKTVIQTSEFEPYGKVVNRAEVDGPSYTGHVQDAATGLTYMQQRYYDPMIGRFLSVDPVTTNSGTGANFNRYWYANNNPYKFKDPDGRYVESAIDVALIVADVADISSNGLNWTNGLSLAANAVGLAVPVGTGFGPAVRATSAAIDAGVNANRTENAVRGGLETRGYRPAAGERTVQGQVDRAVAEAGGNPTVQRGGQDLVRLRSSGHGSSGATATPQNVRNVTPDGRAFTGKGPDRPVSNRDVRELHKAREGQSTSEIRTRRGK